MIRRRPCYIAAPYGSPDPGIRAWNVARACALARLAVAQGLAPIVAHPGILPIYGPYGSPDPEIRAIGLDVDLALVALVASDPQGELWILYSDAGEPSAGVRMEMRAWKEIRNSENGSSGGRWSDYRPVFEAAGLGEIWEILAEPPVTPAIIVAP